MVTVYHSVQCVMCIFCTIYMGLYIYMIYLFGGESGKALIMVSTGLLPCSWSKSRPCYLELLVMVIVKHLNDYDTWLGLNSNKIVVIIPLIYITSYIYNLLYMYITSYIYTSYIYIRCC